MPTVATHPEFGVADPDTGVTLYTNDRNQTYVGGYWGGWRIYANLPAEEVTVEWLIRCEGCDELTHTSHDHLDRRVPVSELDS